MDKIFNQLNVVRVKSAKQRVASLQRLRRRFGRSLRNRVRGIKFRQPVDHSQEAAQVMKLPAAQLVREFEAIASGISRTATSADTLLVYTQCLLDALRTRIVAQKAQTEEAAELREIVATWHHRYRERSVILISDSAN